MIQGVMFDVDGTLVDSVDLHARAWKDAFQRFGRDVPFEEVRRQIGKGADQLLPVFFSNEQLFEFGVQLEEYRAELFKQAYLTRVTVFPKVRELFRKIVGDGKRIVLASSGSKEEIAHYKKLARIEDLVAAETSADDVERSKPYPDIFAVALSRLGINNDEALVVGDTPYDAEAASKLGLETIGLLRGFFKRGSSASWLFCDLSRSRGIARGISTVVTSATQSIARILKFLDSSSWPLLLLMPCFMETSSLHLRKGTDNLIREG